MLSEVPDVCQYLYKVNDRGWFPLFRILHIFSSTSYGFRSKNEIKAKKNANPQNSKINDSKNTETESSICSDMIPNEISDLQTERQEK